MPDWSCSLCPPDSPHRAVCQKRGKPCAPVEWMAGSPRPRREHPIDRDDNRAGIPYLDVINERADDYQANLQVIDDMLAEIRMQDYIAKRRTMIRVMLRSGMSVDEVGMMLRVSGRTVRREGKK